MWRYGQNVNLVMDAPMNSVTPPSYRTLIGEHAIPKPFVCELPDVWLHGPLATVSTSGGQQVLEEAGKESVLYSRAINDLAYNIKSISAKNTSDLRMRVQEHGIEGPVMHMIPRTWGEQGRSSPNYGHWLLEDLPRLRGIEFYERHIGEQVKLLVPENMPVWMRDHLRLLGFDSSSWMNYSFEKVKVNTLVVPKMSRINSHGTEYAPADRAWVADRLKTAADESTATSTKRIFVSRQAQGRRKILNFDEVKRVLDDHGIVSVEPETLSVQEQIQLFGGVELIVGVFGAGLTNMIFAEDASLLEIKPATTQHTVFYILANEFNLDYHLLMSKPRRWARPHNKKNRDLVINTGELDDLLHGILSE
jgi:capsular polysaccharide biosynthesis protein